LMNLFNADTPTRRLADTFPHRGAIARFIIAVAITLSFTDCLAELVVLKDLSPTAMDCAKIVLMLIFSSAIMAGADVVGTLNVHTALSGQAKIGVDTGEPIPVQVDFSKTEDGTYDISVWSGNRQIGAGTRVNVRQGKARRPGASEKGNTVTIYCPATDLRKGGPTSFQIFVQVVLDDGEDAGKVLIAEASWQLGSVGDGQPGGKINPQQLNCFAGNNLDSHATGSFVFENQSDRPLTATLMFGGRKYGDYDLSGHGNQSIRADAWGVNPGVGWYVTTANPNSPGGQDIQAAGPIYNTEGGSDAGFNRVGLVGPKATPTPSIDHSGSPAVKKPNSQK
jgi:hypothetical protein